MAAISSNCRNFSPVCVFHSVGIFVGPATRARLTIKEAGPEIDRLRFNRCEEPKAGPLQRDPKEIRNRGQELETLIGRRNIACLYQSYTN
jgi:hypothetical protein